MGLGAPLARADRGFPGHRATTCSATTAGDAQVIHHGVEREFFEIAQRRDPQGLLLCVSTPHPHKNLERLLRVHAQIEGRAEA